MVLEKVAELITELNGEEVESITVDLPLTELSLDSLDIAELILNIEEEYDITIEDRENLKTVGDVVAYIEANKK